MMAMPRGPWTVVILGTSPVLFFVGVDDGVEGDSSFGARVSADELTSSGLPFDVGFVFTGDTPDRFS